MNKTTIGVALLAGLAGGVISRYTSPAPVLAQQAQAQNPAPVELRAQRFVLIKPDGSVAGTFAVEQPKSTDIPFPFTPPSIRLLDSSGKEIWSAGWESDAKAGSEIVASVLLNVELGFMAQSAESFFRCPTRAKNSLLR
jgi:hypothetical protein